MRRCKRILAMVLTICMILMPTAAFAEEGNPPSPDQSITCPHHPPHTPDCGFADAVPEKPCGDLQEDGTYSCKSEDEGEPATPGDATEGYACLHNDECGYTPGTPGQPCKFDPATCPDCKSVNDSGNVPPCDCTVPCTEETIKADCPVCIAEDADLSACKAPKPQPECDCTVPCTEETIKADCPVCSAADADLTECKGKMQIATWEAPRTTGAEIQTGIGTLKVNTSDATIIWFGENGAAPLSWRVIGYNDTDGVASKGGTIALLAKEGIGATYFDSLNGSYVYDTSELKGKIEGIANGISNEERTAIVPRTLAVGVYSGPPYSDGVAGQEVVDAILWPLSTREAKSVNANLLAIGELWWLRSPGSINYSAACVDGGGWVDSYGIDVSFSYAVRPAFQLNLSSVLFSSAAVGGKSDEEGIFKDASAPTGDLKLTILDNNLTAGTVNATQSGDKLTITCTGATTGKTLSAIITDGSGAVLQYAKLKKNISASDTATVTLPANFNRSTMKLKVFVEEANGDYLTDFASNPTEVTVVPNGIDVTTPWGTPLSVNKQTKAATTKIMYGGKEWLVIGYDNKEVASEIGTMTLLASSGLGDAVIFGGSNQYGSSTLKTAVDGTEGLLNTKEQAAIKPVTLATCPLTGNDHDTDHTGSYYCNGITGNAVNGARLWPLSTEEATLVNEDIRSLGGSNHWWLRSPGDGNYDAAFVDGGGSVSPYGYNVSLNSYAVRPAFKLDLSSVLFSSAATGGKSGNLGQFRGVSAPGDNLKLTILDDTNLALTSATVPVGTTLSAGQTYTITYTGATAGKTLSAIFTDGSGAVQYAKLMENIPADGTATVTLPAGFDTTTMKLKVFVEEAKGNDLTDYACTPKEVTVQADPTTGTHTVSYTLTNITASGQPTSVANLGTLNIALTAQSGYTLPNTISVTMGAKALTAGTGYTYTQSTGVVRITGVTGDVVITANGVQNTTPPTPPTPTPPATPSISTGSGSDSSDTDTRTAFERTVDNLITSIKVARPGTRLTLDMRGNPILPGKVLNALAGKDVTLTLNMGGGVKWVIRGTDVPKGSYGSLNLGVNAKSKKIPVTVINNVTGEVKVMQLALTHNGAFGFAMTLLLETGKENAGLWANLYYYNPTTKALEYRTSSLIDAAGKAALPFNSASDYAVVIDKRNLGAPAFTDISTHWAKTSIDFVAARGLLTGATKTTFSPDSPMTRGMFVTALGRLSRIDTAKYKNTKFTDVKADAYYAPYVAWAAEKGITTGTTDTTFSPDKPITRQELAVFMANYAKVVGYTVPQTRTAVTFADNANIASWAAEAVKAMQMAGILNGKNGNKFDPTGTATRAEVAAVLHRYVELVIDPATAQGLDVNDSGSTMLYEKGNAVKSATRTAGSATYSFNANGEAALLPADNKKTGTYTVQKGDSFWLIAKKYNCTVLELEALNGKSRTDIIYTGQVLKVPQK